jgi:hypothetical protein
LKNESVSAVPIARPSDRRAELRYFFCANSLAASAAREQSKIDPVGTSPFKLAVELKQAVGVELFFFVRQRPNE